MLISMPTGTSTIFGVFQDIFGLLVRGTIFALGTQGNALQKLRQRFICVLQCKKIRNRALIN